MAVTPDGKQAISTSSDNTLKVWDLESGRLHRTLDGHSSAVYGVAVTRDGKRALSASQDHTLKVWDKPSSSTSRQRRWESGVSERDRGAQGHSRTRPALPLS